MINESQIELLVRSQLLSGLDAPQLAAFMKLVTVVQIEAPYAIIVREGEDAENFYMILSGEAEVLKREPRDGTEFPIAALGPGDHFGETALFRQVRRTATIRARTPMTLVMLKTREIREAPHTHEWLAGFLLNLAREGATRLDHRTNKTVAGLRAEVEGDKRGIALNRFLIYAIGGLSLYVITLAFTLRSATTAPVGGLLSDVLYVGLGFLLIGLMMQRSGGLSGSLGAFGFRLSDSWRRELGEAAVATVSLMGLAIALKFALIHSIPALRGFELFEPLDFSSLGIMIGVGYVAFMVMQEVCVRGALQSTLQEILSADRRGVVYAIVLSNGLFAAFHAHASPYFAIMVFVPGLVWGLLYARHRSLLGVSLSHVAVGLWALRVLGLGQIVCAF